jgi:POT family proton-dependent oligopeptide transporter
MSFYGTTAVVVNFIRSSRPDGSRTGAPLDPGTANAQPGALGMGLQSAVAITRFNTFFIYFVPILGAWIAVCSRPNYLPRKYEHMLIRTFV